MTLPIDPDVFDLVSGLRLPCRLRPDLFFSYNLHRPDVTKNLCLTRHARASCLRGAPARREPAGVWDAALFEQGRVIAVNRGRGRPRKNTLEAVR